MTKKYATKQFSRFLPMIEKACWHYSKKYHLEKEDLESQAFLIFCEATKTFNKNLGCFSTHLYSRLQRLDSYCRTNLRRNQSIQHCKSNYGRGYGKSIRTPLITITENNAIYDYCVFDKVITKIDYELSLSNDAKEIVEYITSREWENVGKNWKPRFAYIKKLYYEKGWNRNRIINAWEEIRTWWVGSNKDQFCMEV